MKSPKKLILNADDYGAGASVNAAVEELVAAETLGGVSVLANGSHWNSAVVFLQKNPSVSIGVHLNLVEGQPLSDKGDILRGHDASLLPRGALLARWARHPRAVSQAVEIEWRAQIERLLNAGLTLTHADSHQHLHALPPAFRIAVKLCQEYQIPALRLPCEHNRIATRQLTTLALNASLTLARRLTGATRLRHNDHFLGFKRAGGYGLQELLTDLPKLQPGVTEIALHPSLENFYPYPTLRGKDERDALLSPAFQEQLAREQITLMRWADI